MTFESFILIELCIIAIIFLAKVFGMHRRVGRFESKKIPERNFDGRIVINTKDPHKDVFRIEYDGNVADIPTKEYVTFDVVREDL